MQYTYNSDGSKKILGKYTTKGVATLNRIFPNDKETAQNYIKKRPGVKVELQRKYHTHNNAEFVRLVYTTFLMKVLEHVAEGEVFILPGKTGAHIHLKVNPKSHKLKTDYFIPSFRLDFGPKNRFPDFWIYVPPRLYKEALERSKKGQIDWITIPKTGRVYDEDERFNGRDVRGVSGTDEGVCGEDMSHWYNEDSENDITC